MKATLSYNLSLHKMFAWYHGTFILNFKLYEGKCDLSKIKAYIWLKIILKRP